MNEIILPPRTFTFSAAPYPFVQFSAISSPGAPWGRMFSMGNVGIIGGFPANTCIGYNRDIAWIFQYSKSNIYSYVTEQYVGQGMNPVSMPVYMQNGLFIRGNANTTKGIQWDVNNLFYNFAGFPNPSLPDGIVVSSSIQKLSINNVCWSEGGISCSTHINNAFPGMFGSSSNPVLIYNSGSGCPATNIFGISHVAVNYGVGITNYTVADGSGLGIQPFLSDSNLNRIYSIVGTNSCAQIAPGIVAFLSPQTGFGKNGTIITVCKYFDLSTPPPGVNVCAGKIGIGLYVIYQRDLQDIVGHAAQANCYGLWTDEKGFLLTTVRSIAGSFIIAMQFPGPVIQVINGYPFGGAASNGSIMIRDKDGYLGVLNDAAIYWSSSTLSLNYSINVPIKQMVNQVNASNTMTNVNINRNF